MVLHWLKNKLLISQDEDYIWSNCEEQTRYSQRTPFKYPKQRLIKATKRLFRREED